MNILKENKRTGVRLIYRDDGKFVVVAGEEILGETSVDALAEVTFQEAVEERRHANDIRPSGEYPDVAPQHYSVR